MAQSGTTSRVRQLHVPTVSPRLGQARRSGARGDPLGVIDEGRQRERSSGRAEREIDALVAEADIIISSFNR